MIRRRLRLGCPRLPDLFLEPLGELKQLRELNLTGSSVTPAGAAALRKALPGCRITLGGPR